MKTYKLFINNEWVDAEHRDTFPVINPFNSQVIARVAKATVADVNKAIHAARRAFDSGIWSNATPAERASVLLKLADLVEKNVPRLASLESQQVGKTIKYATDSDFPFIIDNLRFFAGAARILQGIASAEYIDFHARRQHKGLGTSIIRREPLGVVGAIVPWNYPLYIATWKLAPALAAGNSVVIKPASLTPLTLLEFADLAVQAGLPPGVQNVVTGPGDTVGETLLHHDDVDVITFTGDTETGEKILHDLGDIKHLELELGGKAPMVVLPDADLEAAAQGAVVGAFWNTGQDCTAVTRVYVHEKIHASFAKRLVQIAHQFKLGDPADRNTDMGPLISAQQRERVESYIKSGLQQGAKLLCGGKRPQGKLYEKGFFVEPTIFTDVKQHMKIAQEEIFGPVLCVLTYKTIDEVIKKANDVKYGLAASVWGSDLTQALSVARQLRFGTVWINEHGILVSEMPHGGYKQSGFGKDLSMYSFEEFTQIKHIYIDLTHMQRKPWHYTVYGKP